MGATGLVVTPLAIGITQLFPGGIQGQDRAVVPTCIGVMLFDQGAVGGLDFSCGGRGRHTEHAIRVSCSQGEVSASNGLRRGLWEPRPRQTVPIKKPQLRLGLIEMCGEKWRTRRLNMCEGFSTNRF